MAKQPDIITVKSERQTKGLKLRKYARKQPWTQKEDLTLAELVKTHGLKRWSIISSILTNRSAKQCRERWKHQLDPNINTTTWNQSDEWILYLHHAIIGNKWTYLVNFFPGRTDNSIKNHWNTQMRKRMVKYKIRLENAIKLCRVDETLFKASFSTIECRLIEKISKSLIYKRNHALSVEHENKILYQDTAIFNGTISTVNMERIELGHNIPDMLRFGSMSSINERVRALAEHKDHNSKSINKISIPCLPKDHPLTQLDECLFTINPSNSLDCDFNNTHVSNANCQTINQTNNHIYSVVPRILDFNDYACTVNVSLRLEAQQESGPRLSDSEIQRNFSILRKMAADFTKQCMSS